MYNIQYYFAINLICLSRACALRTDNILRPNSAGAYGSFIKLFNIMKFLNVSISIPGWSLDFRSGRKNWKKLQVHIKV